MKAKDFDALIKRYDAEIKSSKTERPLTADEIEGISQNLDNIPTKYKKNFLQAQRGDFSNFQKLPRLLRNYLGALEMKKLRESFGASPSVSDKSVAEYLNANARNAAFRAGVSAEKGSNETKESARAFDAHMNVYLVEKTLMPPTDEEKNALGEAIGSNGLHGALEKNLARQLVIAKTAFLAQLGKYEVSEKNMPVGELTSYIGDTLTHGARTNFVLPKGSDSRVIEEFMGANGGEAAGIHKRAAASHSVKRRTVDEAGCMTSEGKEERTYNPLKIFNGQYGMNIAVGGIGTKGPGGKTVTGEGAEGHLYMRAQKGDPKHCGSLLIGIEGAEPGKTSYLGHSHGIRASSAKQSAFLSDKGIVGKKIDGRTVDLSGISSEDLEAILRGFSEKYKELQEGANTPDGRQKLARLNSLLMGKQMATDKLIGMLTELGAIDNGKVSAIENARRGFVARLDVEAVSGERIRQSLRARVSSKEACNIAEARFAASGNDIELAVGAVKELIFTHETRSLAWRIFHPIKNHRENQKISSLVKRLETEKGFDPRDIAGEMNSFGDSFSFDWGDGLSNDARTVEFLDQNGMGFKAEASELQAVTQKICDSIFKRIGREVMVKETEGMTKDLDQYLKDEQEHGPYEDADVDPTNDDEIDIPPQGNSLDKNSDRESIVISELAADDTGKSFSEVAKTGNEISKRKGI